MFTGLLAREYHDLHLKSRQVCNKTRSPPAWRLFKGQGTKHTTVKWPISRLCSKENSRESNALYLSNTGYPAYGFYARIEISWCRPREKVWDQGPTGAVRARSPEFRLIFQGTCIADR